MYHELAVAGRPLANSSPGYTRYVVLADSFLEQMNGLNLLGWRAMSVSQGLESPHAEGVVVTFDDGCETDLIAAAPVLRRLGFEATFYLTVGYLGRRGHLTLAQARQLGDSGFEIGCHSMTHPYLSDLDASTLEREIAGAKSQLEQWLGAQVEHFSCPGGRYNQRVQDAVRGAGYASMATSRNQGNGKDADRFALGRVAVLRGTSAEKFESLSSGHGLWRLSLEDGARQVLKKTLGNSAYDRVRGAILGDGKRG